MARQLKNAQYAQNAEQREHASEPLRLVDETLKVFVGKQERYVKRQNRNEVDDVERALEELSLVWRRTETQQVLECEPHNADDLDQFEQRIVYVVDGLAAHCQAAHVRPARVLVFERFVQHFNSVFGQRVER